MSHINLLSFFHVNQTGHGSEVLNGLYQRFFSPLHNSLFDRSKREKTFGIQVKGHLDMVFLSSLPNGFAVSSNI